MKTLALVCLVALAAAPLLASDVALESLDYAKLKAVLPSGWIIKSVAVSDAPAGWRRTGGSKGITVSMENPAVTIHDQMVGDYHPMYSFTLMPLDWEGTSLLDAVFAGGRVREKERDRPDQVYPDHFQREYEAFFCFDSYLGTGDWKKPFGDLAKFFDAMGKSSDRREESEK